MLRLLPAWSHLVSLALCIITLSFVDTTSRLQGQEWADLQMTFVYDGTTVPERKPIDMARDSWCVGAHKTIPLSESMIVDATTKGIANVCFYPDPKKSGLEASDVHPSLAKPRTEPVLLDNVNCQFIPHVVFARKGETIRVKNSDQTGHNANFSFFNNPGVNMSVAIGGFQDVALADSEPAAIPVTCGSHPWMEAKLIVTDLPYAGISDAKGVLKIEKLPANKKILFKIYQENQQRSISKVNFGGAEVEWTKGNVELTLKPGMNDLGVVKIKPDQFKE